MLRSVGTDLNGSTILPVDEAIGKVSEAYFDDHSWTIRYLVVETGTWLSGREVLISPYSVKQPLRGDNVIEVGLTREQVRSSPPVDTHQPVSRRHEQEYLGYYGYPEYWGGTDLWAMGSYPMLPAPLPEDLAQVQAEHEAAVPPEDVHLRSTANVTGHDIQASDHSIGHVADFIFDDASWAIRYVVVDTRNWWPGGKRVLIATRWIDRIEWAEAKVYTSLSQQQVRDGPEYDPSVVVDRDYETRLHRAHGRPHYWDPPG